MKKIIALLASITVALSSLFIIVACNKNKDNSDGGKPTTEITKADLVKNVASTDFKSFDFSLLLDVYEKDDYNTSGINIRERYTTTSSKFVYDVATYNFDSINSHSNYNVDDGIKKEKEYDDEYYFVRGNADYSYESDSYYKNYVERDALLASIKSGETVLNYADNNGEYAKTFSAIKPTDASKILGALLNKLNGTVLKDNNGYNLSINLKSELTSLVNTIAEILDAIDKNPQITVLELYELDQTKKLLNGIFENATASKVVEVASNILGSEEIEAQSLIALVFNTDFSKGVDLSTNEGAKELLANYGLPLPTKDETLVSYAKRALISEQLGNILFGEPTTIGSFKPHGIIYQLLYGSAPEEGETVQPLKGLTDDILMTLEKITANAYFHFDTKGAFTGLNLKGSFSTENTNNILKVDIDTSVNVSNESAKLENLTGCKYVSGYNVENGAYNYERTVNAKISTVDENGAEQTTENYIDLTYVFTVENNEISVEFKSKFGEFSKDFGVVYNTDMFKTGRTFFNFIDEPSPNSHPYFDFAQFTCEVDGVEYTVSYGNFYIPFSLHNEPNYNNAYFAIPLSDGIIFPTTVKTATIA